MKTIIYLLVVMMALAYGQQKEDAGQAGQCECAVFKDEKLADDDQALVTKTANLHINCSDPNMKEDCKKMCISLATAAKDQAPQVLCKTIKVHVDDMKPAVFYKVCDITKWEYSGLTANNTICCHEGTPRACANGGTSDVQYTELDKNTSDSTVPPSTMEIGE